MRKYQGIMLGLLFVMAGCAGHKEVLTPEPEDMYVSAYHLFQQKDWTAAAEAFDEVDKQHPYSQWAPRGQIMAGFAYYRAGKYADAVAALDRFIQLHPGNKNMPYALYLKGMCYFEQISDIGREQNMSEQALMSFAVLQARFKTSPYAQDAEKKVAVILDQLAGKELEVGRYYQRHEDYIAAMNRFQYVIQEYPHTAQVIEAYYRLGACYWALGIKGQARLLRDKMNQLYPQNMWTDKLNDLIG